MYREFYDRYDIIVFIREDLRKNCEEVLEQDFNLNDLFTRDFFISSLRTKFRKSREFPLDKCPDTYYNQGYYSLNNLFLEEGDVPIPEDDWWNC